MIHVLGICVNDGILKVLNFGLSGESIFAIWPENTIHVTKGVKTKCDFWIQHIKRIKQ